jgi:hypothetical protein
VRRPSGAAFRPRADRASRHLAPGCSRRVLPTRGAPFADAEAAESSPASSATALGAPPVIRRSPFALMRPRLLGGLLERENDSGVLPDQDSITSEWYPARSRSSSRALFCHAGCPLEPVRKLHDFGGIPRRERSGSLAPVHRGWSRALRPAHGQEFSRLLGSLPLLPSRCPCCFGCVH